MIFTKIRFDGVTTELDWTQQIQGDTQIAQTLTSKEAPASRLRNALKAFGPFVVDLIGVPSSWLEDLEIRQVVLKEEEKTGLRGVVVTALRKVEKAKNRTLLLNTPYLAEMPEDHEGAPNGYIDAETMELIDELEMAALAFKNGERGEQLEAFPNAAVPEEQVTPPKKRRKKGEPRDFIPGAGPVINPTATEAPTDDVLRQLLLSIDHDVPIDAIARWTSIERDAAQLWAMTALQFHLGQAKAEDVPKVPECVTRHETRQLTADEWTDPPRAMPVDVHAIQDATRQ